MKTAKYILPVILAGAMLSGCEKEDIDRFNPEYSALNIWLGSETAPVDELIYNFSYALGEKPVSFYARITGPAAETDRTFTLQAVSGTLTELGQAVRTETYTIPAGEISGEYQIYFDSSKIPASTFADKDGEVVFKMVANDNFAEGAAELSELRFILRNYLSKPEEWDSAASGFYPYRNYFGDYSEVKYRFMIEVTGLQDFRIDWRQSTPYDEATNVMSPNYASYLQQLLRIELDKYNAAHDTPLADSLGNPITF